MRIGILTGGGDVPGLNPAIKAFVNRAAEQGHETVGLLRGWAALLELDPDDPSSFPRHSRQLSPEAVRDIDRAGGTILHSSRTNPGRVAAGDLPEFLPPPTGEPPYDCTGQAVRAAEALGLDAVVAIGGDDTLSYALRMHQEGVPVAAIPKTMDNDVPGTDYCLGFSTAVTRSVGFINNLRTSAGSHQRIAVVELFGRYSGATSLAAGLLSGADRAIIAEVPFHPDRLADLLAADRAANPRRYAVAVISEGAKMAGGERVESGEADPYGHRKLGGIGRLTGERIKTRTGIGVLNQQIGYLMRSGPPDTLDLMAGFNFGIMAADLVSAGRSGLMTVLRNGLYDLADLEVLAAGARTVDVEAFYDEEQYRPRIKNPLSRPMFL